MQILGLLVKICEEQQIYLFIPLVYWCGYIKVGDFSIQKNPIQARSKMLQLHILIDKVYELDSK